MNEVSHVCESSAAKAEIRKNVVKIVEAFTKGAGKTEYDYASLCGAECTQEKDIRAALPAIKFHMTGFEIDGVRASNAQATGIMDRMVCGDIDGEFLPHDITYRDYCWTPIRKLGHKGFSPILDCKKARAIVLASDGSPRLGLYTFSLRDRANGNVETMQRIYDSIYGEGTWAFNNMERRYTNSSTSLANFLLFIFSRLHNVYPVMFRVYHGGNGSNMGSPMLTIGLLICKKADLHKFNLPIISTYATEIECLTEGVEPQQPAEVVQPTATNTKALFSKAVKALHDSGFSNAEIVLMVKDANLGRVASVLAWHKHRASWNKA